MKVGDVINRKYVVKEMLVAGGKSEAAKVRLGDKDLFLKRFTSPLNPYDRTKVEASKLEGKQKACAEFERRHVEILQRLSLPQIGGGNLVKPVDFFREKACYYKAYPFIRADNCLVVSAAAPSAKLLFIKTFLLCVRELHALSVVHSDIKPDNLLVERKPAGMVAKLIDFDEAYVSGHPPKRMGGDPVYFSPELAEHLENGGSGEPGRLTLKSDMFSVGLLLHQLGAGQLPAREGGTGDSPAEVLLSGGALRVDSLPDFPSPLTELIRGCLAVDPNARPGVEKLTSTLGIPPLGDDVSDRGTGAGSLYSSSSSSKDRPTGVISSVGRRTRPS